MLDFSTSPNAGDGEAVVVEVKRDGSEQAPSGAILSRGSDQLAVGTPLIVEFIRSKLTQVGR